MFRKGVMIFGLIVVCGGGALAVQYFNEDIGVVGPGGGDPARIYIKNIDSTFGVPWTAIKDRGGTPAELEIAPVPGQYEQATVKTHLAILGVGQYTLGDEEATAPFDARLLLSGPWPWSYCALRDLGGSPATLEVNPLGEYKDIEATIKNDGEFRVLNEDDDTLLKVTDKGG